MPRVHHVKKARKDNPVAKKGESYYWWKPMVNGYGGAKRYSKTPPSRSDLTQSSYLSTLYEIQDRGCSESADLESEVDGFRCDLESLSSETQDSLMNMPEGLQEGDTGQLMQERIDSCDQAADDLGSVTFEPPDREHHDSDEEYDEAVSAYWTEKAEEVQGILDAVE